MKLPILKKEKKLERRKARGRKCAVVSYRAVFIPMTDGWPEDSEGKSFHSQKNPRSPVSATIKVASGNQLLL